MEKWNFMRIGTFGMMIAAMNFQQLVSAGGGPSREQVDEMLRRDGMIWKDGKLRVRISVRIQDSGVKFIQF